MMTAHRIQLLLFAQLPNAVTTSHVAVSDTQAGHPAMRRLNRIDRAIDAFQGKIIATTDSERLVTFPAAEPAILAGREMQKRCAVLPDVAGQHFPLRIGIHMLTRSDRSNDSQNNAQEIAKHLAAVDDAIIISELAGNLLPPELSQITRPLISPKLDVNALQVDWRSEIAHAAYSGQSFWPSTGGSLLELPYARLNFGLKSYLLNASHPVITVGRDPANDIVLSEGHVSRSHCLIEIHEQKIILTDTSTNGTTIISDDGVESIVKRKSATLSGKGMILPGRPFQQERRGGIRFEAVNE